MCVCVWLNAAAARSRSARCDRCPKKTCDTCLTASLLSPLLPLPAILRPFSGSCGSLWPSTWRWTRHQRVHSLRCGTPHPPPPPLHSLPHVHPSQAYLCVSPSSRVSAFGFNCGSPTRPATAGALTQTVRDAQGCSCTSAPAVFTHPHALTLHALQRIPSFSSHPPSPPTKKKGNSGKQSPPRAPLDTPALHRPYLLSRALVVHWERGVYGAPPTLSAALPLVILRPLAYSLLCVWACVTPSTHKHTLAPSPLLLWSACWCATYSFFVFPPPFHYTPPPPPVASRRRSALSSSHPSSASCGCARACVPSRLPGSPAHYRCYLEFS